MDKNLEPLSKILEKTDIKFEDIANKVRVTPRHIYKIKNRQVEASGDTELAIRNYIEYDEAAPKKNELDQVKDLCLIISNILNKEVKNSASRYVVGASLIGALKILGKTPKYITDEAIYESHPSEGLQTINIIPVKIMRNIIYDNLIYDKESLFDLVNFASQKIIITKSENQRLLSHKGELFEYFYKQISINNSAQNWEDLTKGAYDRIRINTSGLEDILKKELHKNIGVLKNIFGYLNIKTEKEVSKLMSIDVRDSEDILNQIKQEKSNI